MPNCYYQTPPTKEEYIELLKKHDWYYEFSDDHRVWAAGHASAKHLSSLALVFDPDFEILKTFAPKGIAIY
jgi:hypothetical protein